MTYTEEYKQKWHEIRVWYADRLRELCMKHSLHEVAQIEGLSVYQIRSAVFAALGQPLRVRTRNLELETRVQKREAKSKRSYGCGWEEFQRITGLRTMHGSRGHPLLKMYWHHRDHANRLKIGWDISLPAYAEIVGPHLSDFGLARGAKVLGRIDKNEPYRIGNLEVVTLQANSAATKGLVSARGFVTSRKKKNIERVVELTAKGLSINEIAKRMGVCKATVSQNIKIAKNTGLMSA